MPRKFSALALLFGALVGACSNAPIQPPGDGHLRDEKTGAGAAGIPAPVQQITTLPRPQPGAKVETYSVVVNNVRVQELLFALARDAKINVDIHPGIEGTVTLNAINQTLQQLLTRIAKQVDLRWELDGPNLAVMPDSPFLRTYRVDYVNMSRDTSGSVTVTSQIGSPGASAVGAAGGGGGSAGSSSSTKIENKAQNRFWDTLIQNVKDLLRETDKILPEGSSETVVERSDQQAASGIGATPGSASGGQAAAAPPGVASGTNAAISQQGGATLVKRTTFREAASVIANPEAGIISVRATARQHEKVQEFLDQVLTSARRQVLIEATIAEVQLSDNYQQGIDWGRMRFNALGFTLIQRVGATSKIASPPSSLFELAYINPGSQLGNIAATAKLLEAFGTVKVLSSPKLSVLNNQTAVLKVVDNNVYFTVASSTNQNQTQTVVTYTTTVHSVPVGFVMNVTPQISGNDTVLLNIRPTLSRIIGIVIDPNPALKKGTTSGLSSDIVNEIPIIRSREMESVIKVDNGNIAVMGGIMEDTLDNTDNAVPGLSKLPVLGTLFTHRNDTRRKTELVIFLRPVVVRDASIDGDYADYRGQLPGRDFFEKGNIGPQRQQLDYGGARQ